MVAMLLLALAPASYLLAPAPARHRVAHQSCTPRARVLLSENTEHEAKAAAAAEANEALQQQCVELKMQYAGATERLRVRDEQLQDLQAGAQPISSASPSHASASRSLAPAHFTLAPAHLTLAPALTRGSPQPGSVLAEPQPQPQPEPRTPNLTPGQAEV